MRYTRKSYVGQTFGRWYVAGDAPDRDGLRFIICRCTCGVTKTIRLSNIVQNRSKSCGCLKHEILTTPGAERRGWQPHEIKAIRKLYPRGGAEAVHRVLPNRTVTAIRLKASMIAVRYVRELYP